MNDPERLADGPKGDLGGALLRSMRDDAPSPGQRERLLLTLGAGATASAAGLTAGLKAAGAAAAPRLPGVLLFKGWLVVALGSVAASTLLILARPSPPATGSPPQVAAPAPRLSGRALGAAPPAEIPPPPAPLAAPAPVAAPLRPAPGEVSLPSSPLASAKVPIPPRPPALDEATSLPRAAPSSPPAAAQKAPAPPQVPAERPALEASGGGDEPAVVTPAVPALSEELAELHLARAALGRGDGAAALSAIGAYRQRYPRPRLGMEATVLQIEALVLLGRREEAHRLGRDFLAASPRSAFAPRVRALMGPGGD